MKSSVLDELGRQIAFGMICGSVTGFSMGLVDTYNKVRREPRDLNATTRLAFNEMARSGVVVASFFSWYQVIKYATKASDVYALCATATVSLLPLALVAPLRRYIVFSLTLVAVDAYHTTTAASTQHQRRRQSSP